MISFLSGTVAEATLTSVVIDVSGIGFECGVSTQTVSKLPPPGSGERCILYTKMQVREDDISLYGFATQEERWLFERLVSITGVGPKVALSVLSTFSPAGLRDVVATGDEKRMATVPGVGKKTASRMILELKDSLKTIVGSDGPAQVDTSVGTDDMPSSDETIAALLSMGFTEKECEFALRGFEDRTGDVSAAIKYALKRLGS